MRVESVDEVEIIRRMSEEIYDKAEYEKALAWAKEPAGSASIRIRSGFRTPTRKNRNSLNLW